MVVTLLLDAGWLCCYSSRPVPTKPRLGATQTVRIDSGRLPRSTTGPVGPPAAVASSSGGVDVIVDENDGLWARMRGGEWCEVTEQAEEQLLRLIPSHLIHTQVVWSG